MHWRVLTYRELSYSFSYSYNRWEFSEKFRFLYEICKTIKYINYSEILPTIQYFLKF